MMSTIVRFLPPRFLWRAGKLFVGAATVGTLVLWSYYFLEQTRLHEQLAQREALAVKLAKESIAAKLQDLGADFQALAALPELAAYLKAPGPRTRAALGEAIRIFASAKRSYDQLRFLDVQGLEKVRVNQHGREAVIVPAEQLQSKSNRPYFTDALALPQGGITVSPLDLNVEKNRIEEPFKPMLRLSGPIHDAQGQLRGVLVLNYLAAHILRGLDASGVVSSGRLLLLNGEGFWLKGLTPEDEWGFMLPQRKDRVIARRWPAAWGQMVQAQSGQALTDEGLFTFEALRPLEQDNASQTKPHWYLLSWDSPAVRQDAVRSLRQMALLFGAFFLIVAALGCVGLSWVDTKRKDAEQAVREREKLYRTLAENFPNGAVMLLQPDMSCVLAEGKGLQPMGLLGQHLEGRRLCEVFPPEAMGTIEEHVAKAMQGETVSFETCANNECYLSHIVPIYHDNGQMIAAMCMVQNISERKNLENALLAAATVDTLTGLYNRRRFNEQLDLLLGLAARYETPLCLCICDIDHFKHVNDTYGHAVGDMTLVRFGETAQKALRETDFIARLGGDEFGILLPQTRIDDAVSVLERFCNELSAQEMDAGPQGRFAITSSLGVAQFEPGMTAEAFMEKADTALYAAKHEGRNRVRS